MIIGGFFPNLLRFFRLNRFFVFYYIFWGSNGFTGFLLIYISHLHCKYSWIFLFWGIFAHIYMNNCFSELNKLLWNRKLFKCPLECQIWHWNGISADERTNVLLQVVLQVVDYNMVLELRFTLKSPYSFKSPFSMKKNQKHLEYCIKH